MTASQWHPGLLVRTKDRNLMPAMRPVPARMQAAEIKYSQSFFEASDVTSEKILNCLALGIELIEQYE